MASATVRARSAFQASLWALGAIGAAYLIWKCVQAASVPGYDFRFFWAAGAMWREGLNPYGPDYETFAAQYLSQGNTPSIWAYPPNAYPLTLLMSIGGVESAARIFAALNFALLLGGAWLLARVGGDAAQEGPGLMRLRAVFVGEGLLAQINRFCLILFALASLEATAISLVVGQSSIVLFFGSAALAYGLAHRSLIWSIAGLTLACLKPQVGLSFLVLALMHGPLGRRAIAGAAVASLVAAVTPMLISIAAPLEWLGNVLAYDTRAPAANAATAMTGLRVLVHDFGGVDIGTLPSALFAVAASALFLWWNRHEIQSEAAPARGALVGMSAAVASLVAFAPLHIYDFTVLGVVVLTLGLWARDATAVLAALGAALIWRADTLAEITGFHNPDAEVFIGSNVATLGALLLFAATVRLVRAPHMEQTRL